MLSQSRLCVWTIGLLVVFTYQLASASEPQWWTDQKRACNLSPSLAYNDWVRSGSPCNRDNGGNSNDNGAAARARAEAAAAAEAQRQRDAELEQQRVDVENQRRREEAARQAKFIEDRDAAVSTLRGSSGTAVSVGSGLRGSIVTTDASGLRGSSSADDLKLKNGSLRDAVADTSSDQDTTTGSFGTKVAHPTTRARVASGSQSDTKAGDQLVGAAATASAHGDLSANYDVGGAKSAGSLAKPSNFASYRSTFSPRVQHDARMVTALKQLDGLTAKRVQLTTELNRLTVARNQEKDPKKSQDLTKQLNQTNADFQTTLITITKAEEKVKMTKRIIETEVESTPTVVAGPAAKK